VSPEQCRQARRLLGITQIELASRSGLCQASVALYERSGHLSAERVATLREALEAAGAKFTREAVLVPSADLEFLSGEQCREARRLLGWSQEQLTLASGVAISQVSSFERRGSSLSPRRDRNRARKLRIALDVAGIDFDGHGPGVRLRKTVQ